MISQLNIYLLAVVEGALELSLLAPILFSFMPQYLPIVLSLSFFIAIIITLNRLQNSNELIIMMTCGISRNGIAALFLPLAVALFVISLVLSLFVTPYSSRKAQEILTFQENLDSLDTITPQTFIPLNDNMTLYTEGLSDDKKTIYHIYLFSYPEKKGDSSQVIHAEQATLVHKHGLRHIKMSEGYQVQATPGKANIVRTNFSEAIIKLPPRNKTVRISDKESFDNSQLFASNDPEIYQFLFWRISVALFTPVLFIIAIYMFSSASRHSSSAKNFLVLFMTCILYLGANTIVFSIASDGAIPPEIGYGAVHLTTILIAVTFYRFNLRST